jgi:hypothetical protein
VKEIPVNAFREIGCEQRMTSFRGQATWVKMTSPKGKLTVLTCQPTN